MTGEYPPDAGPAEKANCADPTGGMEPWDGDSHPWIALHHRRLDDSPLQTVLETWGVKSPGLYEPHHPRREDGFAGVGRSWGEKVPSPLAGRNSSPATTGDRVGPLQAPVRLLPAEAAH